MIFAVFHKLCSQEKTQLEDCSLEEIQHLQNNLTFPFLQERVIQRLILEKSLSVCLSCPIRKQHTLY